MSSNKHKKVKKPVTKKQLVIWWTLGIALAIVFPLINVFTNINGYSAVSMTYFVTKLSSGKNFNVTFRFSKPTKGGLVTLTQYNTLIGEQSFTVSIPKSQYSYSKLFYFTDNTISLTLGTYKIPAQWNFTTLPIMLTAALPMGYASSLSKRYKQENSQIKEIYKKN